MYEPSIGVSAIDVADVPGAVVVRVDSTTAAGLAPGDIIVKAGTQTIQNASELADLVAREKPDGNLTIEARSAGNSAKQVTLRVAAAPRAISLADQTLVPNVLIPVLRERASRGGPDEPVARLNLAIALIRVENWALARSELERVTLPSGPGVSAGTVKYLLGLCYEALGLTAEAKATQSTLGDDGPSVKEAAEAKLRGKRP
ncbi:MAG: PDZ domain-containing protein, partial [Acidobacteria bacterium]|nr:PDZ domain-containing protein [Acidobacteriota bacterium]